MSEPHKPVPPLHGDPLLVAHLEGNKRWLARYRKAVSEGALTEESAKKRSHSSPKPRKK
jgi:hypothetical protein